MRPLKAVVIHKDTTTETEIRTFLANDGFSMVEITLTDDLPRQVRDAGVDICLVGGHVGSVDCFDIARRLRKDTASGVIVLGDTYDEVDVVLALEMGADDFIAKPLRMRELAARARSVMRRATVTRVDEAGVCPLPDTYLRRIDDIAICSVLRSVSVAGQQVALTSLEFDVLAVLALHVNEVVGRAEIVAEVRGEHWAINPRMVDSVVSRLRRKMFPGGEGPERIRTIHGRGYMLVRLGAEEGVAAHGASENQRL